MLKSRRIWHHCIWSLWTALVCIWQICGVWGQNKVRQVTHLGDVRACRSHTNSICWLIAIWDVSSLFWQRIMIFLPHFLPIFIMKSTYTRFPLSFLWRTQKYINVFAMGESVFWCIQSHFLLHGRKIFRIRILVYMARKSMQAESYHGGRIPRRIRYCFCAWLSIAIVLFISSDENTK